MILAIILIILGATILVSLIGIVLGLFVSTIPFIIIALDIVIFVFIIKALFCKKKKKN